MNHIIRPNAIMQGELCLKYDAYWKTWNRVIHMDIGGPNMVEVNLTPVNPLEEKSWVNQVYPIMIRSHVTAMDAGDRLYRHIVKSKSSRVYEELKKVMLRHVTIELMFRLLNEDFLENIDWAKYNAMRYSPSFRGGGVPFALCKRSPS